MSFEGNLFGPDGNTFADPGKIYDFQLPAGASLDLEFSSEARFENAICIYEGDHLSEVCQKGNRDKI